MHTHLVDAQTLRAHLDGWVVFDVRHDLKDPDWGPRAYQKGHIPGAFHAHVDRDLSGPVGDRSRGRHPLPIPGAFVRFLQVHGVDPDTQVVAYDDVGGQWAGRLWWLLRHYGHRAVALLDGGLAQWKAAGLPIEAARPRARSGSFQGQPGHMPTVDALRIEAQGDGGYQLLDARASPRFRGEVEPIDPVAGHIPGAVNVPFEGNLGPDGRFLAPEALRARYEEALRVQHAGRAAVYCGSGVTAAHDILAIEMAGMDTPALYPGGWSEWCHPDAGRPVEKGEAKTVA